jgi:hypothetical protein
MRRRGLIAALAGTVVAIASLTVALVDGPDDRLPPPAQPPPAPARAVEVVVQDDAQLREAPPQRVRQAAQQLAALGVDRVRFTGSWVGLAPEPQSTVKPAFDDSDPAAYSAEGWRKLDTAVAETLRAGMKPMIDVSFWAPRWAVARPSREPDQGRWRPSIESFGHFAGALATRYSGRYVDPANGARLPAVRLWTTWNEPNHPAFLLPQWERRDGHWVPASPHWYRAMHEAADAAIRAVDAHNRVLIGGLSSIGHERPGIAARMPPLRFLRELACVDSRLRPLRRPECRDFHPLRADGFAIHPYGFSLPPDGEPQLRDNVTLAGIPRLAALLAALQRRGRIAGPLPIFVTELGWETNPPDPYRGVPPEVQAHYLSQSLAMAWRAPEVRMTAWYLLRDIPADATAPPGSRAAMRTFQTGLELADGTPKPALQALRLALWIGPKDQGGGTAGSGGATGSGYRAWARVGPGTGAQQVVFEQEQPNDAWRAISPVLSTRADGTIERDLPEGGTYQVRWLVPGGRDEWSLPVNTPGP